MLMRLKTVAERTKRTAKKNSLVVLSLGYTKKILMRTNLRKHWICMKLRVRCWIILKCGQLCMTRCAYLFIHECIIYESTSRTVDLDLESLIS